MRKPISVSTTDKLIIAICDDGTIWSKQISRSNGGSMVFESWAQLSNIPQEKPKIPETDKGT